MIKLWIVTVFFGAAAVAIAILRGLHGNRTQGNPGKEDAVEHFTPPEGGHETLYFFMPALLFVVAAVMVGVLSPVAVVFQAHRLAGLVAMVAFFALPTLGFAFLWRFGYLGQRGAPMKRKGR